MRWYQRLFWRIFGAVWLISLLGILVSLGVYQQVSGERERVDLLHERARIYAEQIIDDLEKGREIKERHGRRLPIWILEEHSGRALYGDRRRPPQDAVSIEIESESGRDYKVLFPAGTEAVALDRIVGMLVSVQAVWLLVVSLLSSLLLTWLIVRPINALRAHVRSVHDNENLAARADLKLSNRKDELGSLAREIDQMADYVERTLSAQENLLRDVSHELRAPLARLQASAGLAEQKLGENDKLVVRINTECGRLERLISELLLLSRQQVAQANQPRVQLKPLLESLVDDARLLEPQRSIEADMAGVGSGVNFGAEPLSRIVSNLLTNAIKHAGDTAAIKLRAITTTEQLKVEVLDEGQGVSPELLAQLGQPFKRGANSTGYGLGLSICQRAARQLGGEVRFANRETGGFSATLILPIK